MSEKQRFDYEAHEKVEDRPEKVGNKEAFEHQDQAEKHSGKLDSIETIRRSIEEKAQSSKEEQISLDKEGETLPQSTTLVNSELKNVAFNRIIKRTQRHLNTVERGFSKVMHVPSVEKISDFSSKTIARPSGLFGGALVALIGSSTLLYLAKHYGFEYNNLVFVILFFIGFAISVVIEMVMKPIKRKS